MASSFRIKLKLPPNPNGSGAGGEGGAPRAQNKTATTTTNSSSSHRQSGAHPSSSQVNSPSSRSSAFERGSSLAGADEHSSVISGAEDEGEEDEIDELEDSPPPRDQQDELKRMSARRGLGSKVRKLSGAAAIKAANNLKQGKAKAVKAEPRSSLSRLDMSPSPSAEDSYRRDGRSVSANPSIASESPGLSPTSSTGGARKRIVLNEFGKPIDQMSIEEIEALPAAKRRKGLKARGAAGPGRGWRKGLKMDQKPVYRQPGESPPASVAPGTPNSFSTRPRSSLGRDAFSKTGTPVRMNSPYSRGSPFDDSVATTGLGIAADESAASVSAPSRTISASHAAVAARKARAAGLLDDSSFSAATAPAMAASASASGSINPPQPSKAAQQPTQADEGRAIKAIMRGAPTVLPPVKIPIGFVVPAPLDKEGAKRPARKWERREREILSLGGRAWSAIAWITSEGQDDASNAEAIAKTSDGRKSTTNAAGDAKQARDVSTAATAPTTGQVTPLALTSSRAASPNVSTTQAGEAMQSSPLAAKHPLKRSDSPTANRKALVSPTDSTSSASLPKAKNSSGTGSTGGPATMSASDWRGSSAAFTAANRSRS